MKWILLLLTVIISAVTVRTLGQLGDMAQMRTLVDSQNLLGCTETDLRDAHLKFHERR